MLYTRGRIQRRLMLLDRRKELRRVSFIKKKATGLDGFILFGSERAAAAVAAVAHWLIVGRDLNKNKWIKALFFFHFSARHGAPHSAIVCWPIRAGRREREEICTTIAEEEEELLYSGGLYSDDDGDARFYSFVRPSAQPTANQPQSAAVDWR